MQRCSPRKCLTQISRQSLFCPSGDGKGTKSNFLAWLHIHIRTRRVQLMWNLEDSESGSPHFSLINNLLNRAVWTSWGHVWWAPAAQLSIRGKQENQATFGNLDPSYKQVLVSKGDGFWYLCLVLFEQHYQQEYKHFPRGQAGGITKACLCQVSFQQCGPCPTQPHQKVQWVGPRSASGLTLAVRPLGGHHMQCGLHTGSPWVAKKSVLSPNLHGHNGFFGSDRRQQVFLR